MPQLVKNIQGNTIDQISGESSIIKSVSSEMQEEDYINMGGFVAFLQDFSRTEKLEKLTKPLLYGLRMPNNIQVKTLNISFDNI